MSPEQTRVVVQGELGGTPLEDVFEWLDLETPLGSASIAQVLPPVKLMSVPLHLPDWQTTSVCALAALHTGPPAQARELNMVQVHKGKLRGDGRQKQAHRQQKPPWWTLGFHALSFNSAAGWESANCANEELGESVLLLISSIKLHQAHTPPANCLY